jgi:YD repeat-containing protein
MNSAAGAPLCTSTGTNALTTTVTAYALSCATSGAVAIGVADRFYLWVGVDLTAAPGNTSVKAQLSIEGSVNGNFDSVVVAPLPLLKPTITGVSPTSGPVGTVVSIAGMNFGTSQGASQVAFNGTVAPVVSWIATAISARVPAGATTGPITVSVGGIASNSVPFTLITDGSIRGVVVRADDRSAVPGAVVELLRNGTVVSSGSTTAAGQYTVGPIVAGTYGLRASAAGFVTVSKEFVAVTAGEVRTEDFALVAAGGITGRIVDAQTNAPLPGAVVTAIGVASTASGDSDSSGAFTIPGLPAGAYTVTARIEAYRPASASVTVADGALTAQSFALNRGTVTYAYDELDRLIAVVDPSGDGATYRYDAAGNILGIARQSADTLSIFGFTPLKGAAGTAVTIAGTAFAPLTTSNSVRFNGTAAGVVSASDTQIVAIVPTGATTGLISIATGGSSASTARPFTIVEGGGQPTITGFSPPIASVGSLLITGTNFDVQPGNTRVSENLASMVVTAVRADTLEATLPPDVSSGHVVVRTPDGAAVSDGILFVPPPGYSATDINFTAYTAIGQSVPLPSSTGGIALVAFDAMAGQRIAMRHSVNSPKQLIGPLGREVGRFWQFFPAVTLPADGTYTIIEYPCFWECTATLDLTVFAVPPDVTAVVGPDDPPLTFDLTGAGQRARLVFTGARGQHIMLTMNAGTSYLRASLVDANGFNLFRYSEYLESESPVEFVLPEAGTYSFILDTEGYFDTGHFEVALRYISDTVVTVEVEGPAVTAATTQANDDIYAIFTAAAGTHLTITFSEVTFPYWSQITLRDPNDRVVVEQYLGTGPDPEGRLIECDVSETGTYRLLIDVDRYGGAAGSVAIQVSSRADVANRIARRARPPGATSPFITIP